MAVFCKARAKFRACNRAASHSSTTQTHRHTHTFMIPVIEILERIFTVIQHHAGVKFRHLVRVDLSPNKERAPKSSMI
jgi:zona occludens toxin (predicted ATPase)